MTTPETPVGTDPVSRLVETLTREGYTAVHDAEEWKEYGEQVYHRTERVSFVRGETVFILIDFPDLDDRVLRSAVANIAELYRARTHKDRAFSFFQATTVYVCIIGRNESPHNARLARYIISVGGVVIIPVIIVPEINHVVYPRKEESKLGSIQPRIEYLQHILGERREPVQIHRQTIRTFYAASAVLLVVIAAILFTLFS